ncbi:hypothetical protein ACHAW6_003847 [Cyclotella cf. meneghiniana]
MAGCDHKCRFRWADVRHPGCNSDYTVWITSQMDKYYDNSHTWQVPDTVPDAYNFYLSQLRITTKRAFGIWYIGFESFEALCLCPSRMCLQLQWV